VVALDGSKPAIEAASENLKEEALAGRAEVLCLRAQSFFRDRRNRDRFDRVAINPPFFIEGSGFANKVSLDQLARHDRSLPMNLWVAGVAKLLRTGGELYCVFPTERLAELCAALVKYELQPKDIWWARTDKRRRRFFMRAVRGAKTGVMIHEIEGASKTVR
jgi:tRNA1(Val) A37 N6-methylase TrmN6